jgi:lysophospholipase L1-like esterase
MPRQLLWSAIAAGTLAASCGGSSKSPAGPTTPPQPFQITCPAPQSIESATGAPIAITFAPPGIVAATPPVSTTCTPSSGASFNLGTTTVNCTAKDAVHPPISCAFNVTVTRPGLLSKTKFMAFGDSITWGQLSGVGCNPPKTTVTTRELIRRDFETLFPFPRGATNPAAPSTSYPSVLGALLVGRYGTQSPAVINEGYPGEFVTDSFNGTSDPTLARLRAALAADAPQVMLLQEGINDLNSFGHQKALIGTVIKALRDMIRIARQSGNVQVFVGTLLPEDPSGCRGTLGFDLVADANDQIRTMAASEGVFVVDLYAALGGIPGPYIPVEDGLHPNALGYQKIAQAFFDTIRAQLEVPR